VTASSSALRGSWRRARAVPGPVRGAAVRAWLLLPVVSVGLRVAGYRRVRSALARWPVRPRPGFDPDHASRAVEIAAARSPLPASCLARALTLWALLRRAGLDPRVHLGVARPGGAFSAHAWVECDDRSYGHDHELGFRSLHP